MEGAAFEIAMANHDPVAFEVAQETLADTQSAILPLVTYLDTLHWVLIAVTSPVLRSRRVRGSMSGSGAGGDPSTRSTLASSAPIGASSSIPILPSTGR